MNRCVCALLLLPSLLTVSVTQARAGEVNIVEWLNNRLAPKPKVIRTRTERVQHAECRTRHVGGDWFDECHRADYDQQINFPDFARVVNSEIKEVRNLVFDRTKITGLPEQALMARQEYRNCGPGQLSVGASLSISGTQGYSVTKTSGVSTTIGASVTLSGGFAWGSMSTSMSISTTMSLSTSRTESESTTVTRANNANVSIEPGKQGVLSLVAFQTTVQVPFSATVVVDGNLEGNTSGVTRASNLLSEEERTLPFEGVLTISGVSDAKVVNDVLPGALACEGDQVNASQTTTSRVAVPASSLPQPFINRLQPVHAFTVSLTQPLSTDGSTIGPPDGVIYEAVTSTVVQHPTPACGFNDLSIPKMGSFLVETRRYTNWSHGTILATWTNDVETFQNCAGD